jgi:aminoglycoside phosphotransferase (APT) family kinase protein
MIPNTHQLLSSPGVMIAASRDPDAKISFLTVPQRGREALVVKVPTTPAAARAVENEARLLVELRRMQLGDLAPKLPRYVGTVEVGGLRALVATRLPATPMSVSYHRWLHTATPRRVRRDFAMAGAFLAALQDRTSGPPDTLVWPRQVVDGVQGRWDGHDSLPRALSLLEGARERLENHRLPRVAVHGDYWFGNLLASGECVAGVVDWEAGELNGCPLADLARFALSYSLYLDRHTRVGSAVRGHRGLRREGFGPGVRYALCGSTWYARVVRDFLVGGLRRLGVPGSLWYDAAVIGLGDIAQSANDDEFGRGHLEILASLPTRPRRQ